jgi:septation ring formation regulator EzrA
MPLTHDQFERLVGMLAENRAAITSGLAALQVDLEHAQETSRKRFEELKQGIALTQKTLDVMEEDLGKVQSVVREVKAEVGKHTQAIEGLTELTSTNFDLVESLNKHVLGESGSISHDAAIRGPRPQ